TGPEVTCEQRTGLENSSECQTIIPHVILALHHDARRKPVFCPGHSVAADRTASIDSIRTKVAHANFAGFHRGMLSFTRAPITMDITEKRVRFSGPESSVDMEVLSGFGGKPVKVMNLPSAAFQDYTQYKSASHKHASDKATFSYSGTNGFTSTMDIGSKP